MAIDKTNMERVFANRTEACEVTDSGSVYWKRTQVRAVLEQAIERAIQTGRTTPVSLVWTLPTADPLRVFRALHRLSSADSFYWEQPSRRLALAGTGIALRLQTQGNERFTDAARTWQELRDDAVIAYAPGIVPNSTHTELGPVLFGGFSFDPQRPRTALWQDFPDGLLILPSLLFRQYDGHATMTLSCVVQATANLDKLVDQLRGEIARFSTLLASLPALPGGIPLEHGDNALHNVWPTAAWKELVEQTVSAIRRGDYAKVVLAREAQVAANGHPFSLAATLQQLRQSYPGAHIFAFQRGERAFIGATPERLVHAQNGKLHTMALAGSAPRGANEEEDRRLGCELLDSRKNHEEHEIVTATLRGSLAHLCSRLWVADTPELLRLKNIQHLQTAIVGELLPGRSVLEALHALHPTPAVGGSPTEAALAYIREYENLDRGWYAGPIGWVDLHGNGEFAVALRSAMLEARQATLFAGCGIVRDSDPDAEYAESCLKLQVILRSLSGEE
jgi:isochorismate synthase